MSVTWMSETRSRARREGEQPVNIIGYLISLVIVGLVIGGLGRLLVPGPDPFGLWATLGVGLVGALVGGVLGGLLGLGLFSLVFEIGISAGLVYHLSGRIDASHRGLVSRKGFSMLGMGGLLTEVPHNVPVVHVIFDAPGRRRGPRQGGGGTEIRQRLHPEPGHQVTKTLVPNVRLLWSRWRGPGVTSATGSKKTADQAGEDHRPITLHGVARTLYPLHPQGGLTGSHLRLVVVVHVGRASATDQHHGHRDGFTSSHRSVKSTGPWPSRRRRS